MSKPPISIEVKNARHFYDIAMLIDQPDYLSWIEVIRNNLNITNQSFDKYMDFYTHVFNQGMDKIDYLKNEIIRVRTSFKRTPNYDKVIEYSIAFKNIPDEIYSTCYSEVIVDCKDPEDTSLEKFAIIITPSTTLNELKLVFSKLKKRLNELYKPSLPETDYISDNLLHISSPTHKSPPRKITTDIKRNRELYWESKDSNKLQTSKANKDKIGIEVDSIEDAISSYEKSLEAYRV